MRIELIKTKSVSALVLPLFAVLLLVPSNSASNLESKWKFLPNDTCGYNIPSDRIVGGQEAALGQFPWIARLGYQNEPKDTYLQYYCAANIISRWYVVTGSHCFRNERLRNTIKKVRVGETVLYEDIDCEKGVCAPPVQDLDLDYYVRYSGPKMESAETYGDIALVKVATPIQFHDFVQPICLPGPFIRYHVDLSPGTIMTAAGWGSVNPENSQDYPTRLLYTQLPLIDREICREIFDERIIDDANLCAGDGKGKDTCGGDSGGPLTKAVVVDGQPRYFLFGITSYGLKWCGAGPAIYSNVTAYIDWILENIEPIL